MRFPSPSFVVACLLLGAFGASTAFSQTDLGGDRRVVVEDADAAFVVAPGSVITLRARVTDASGASVGGDQVIFATDFRQAAGDFGGGLSQSVTAGGGGIAEASFTVGAAPGVYFLGAAVEGEAATATIAVTVGADLGEPALSAAEARVLVANATLPSASNGVEASLHGPVLLPAGARITTPAPKLGWERDNPISTTEPTWLLWVDEQPLAGFAHSVRWALVPAGQGGGSRMRLLNQLWWPVVSLPGALTRYSLGPRVDDAGDLSPAALLDETAKFAGPIGREGSAPANSCAVVVYGPGLVGGREDMVEMSDYLTDNDLVSSGNVFRNRLATGGRPSPTAPDQTATRAEFQGLLNQAAAAGCTKLYLILRGHGAPNGGRADGGIQLADDGAGDNGFVSYEDLVRMLAPFQGKELCVIISSCYSGQLALWLQGHGFTGQVMTDADTMHVSYMDANGSKFFTAIVPILTNSSADANGDGVVSFLEAIAYLNTVGQDDSVLGARPSGAGISPTGTRQGVASHLFIPSRSSSRTFFFPRPKALPSDRPFTVTIDVRDDGIANAGGFENAQFPVPPFAPGASIQLFGRECGETTYTVRYTDLISGQEYVGESTVEVHRFKFDKQEIVLQMGATGNPLGGAMVTQFGAWYRSAANNAIAYTITSANPTIARPGMGVVLARHGEASRSIVAEGLMPGRTVFTVMDSNGWTKQIPVVVLGPPPPPAPSAAPCPATNGEPINYEGRANVMLRVKSDPSGHRPFVNAPTNTQFDIRIENGVLIISGGPTQLVPGEGPFDGATCTGSATGISTGRIAGFPNVQGRYMNVTVEFPNLGKNLSMEGGSPRQTALPTLTFDYELGGRGEFPGGMPIIYAGTGTLPAIGGACSYLLLPSKNSYPSTGGAGQVSVVPSAGCRWTIEDDADWLTFTTIEGEGATLVAFTVAPNPAGGMRSATVQVGGESFAVVQTGAAMDPPLIADLGVVNGATFQTGITSGGWFTIAGKNYSDVARVWGDSDFPGGALPTSLEGVKVRVNGRPGFVSFVSDTQLNVLADEDPTLGPVSVEVETPNGVSETFLVDKRAFEPEFFRFAPEGGRYIAAVHPDGTIVGKDGLFATITTRAARPGDILQVFGTGFGPTNPPTPVGSLVTQARPLQFAVTVLINGQPAEVLFEGIVASGLCQFNIRVPDLPPGDYRIEIFIEGRELAAPAFLTIGG